MIRFCGVYWKSVWGAIQETHKKKRERLTTRFHFVWLMTVAQILPWNYLRKTGTKWLLDDWRKCLYYTCDCARQTAFRDDSCFNITRARRSVLRISKNPIDPSYGRRIKNTHRTIRTRPAIDPGLSIFDRSVLLHKKSTTRKHNNSIAATIVSLHPP